MEPVTKKSPSPHPAEMEGGPLHRIPPWVIWIGTFVAVSLLVYKAGTLRQPTEISYSKLIDLVEKSKVEEVEFEGPLVQGKLKEEVDLQDEPEREPRLGKEFRVTILPVQDDKLVELLRTHGVKV